MMRICFSQLWRLEIQDGALGDLAPGESLLPGLQMAIFSRCPHMAVSKSMLWSLFLLLQGH